MEEELKIKNEEYFLNKQNIKDKYENELKLIENNYEQNKNEITNKYKAIDDNNKNIYEKELSNLNDKYKRKIQRYNYDEYIENLDYLKRLNEIIYNTYNTYNNNYFNAININNILISIFNNKTYIKDDLNNEYENIIKIKNGTINNKNKNKIKYNNNLDNIKSLIVFKKIFSCITEKKKLEIIHYNKMLQNNLNINLNNYRSLTGKYLKYETIVKEYVGDKLEYEGEYLNGKRNGKGKEYDRGKLIFEGEYINGKKWNGKVFDNNNLIYELKEGKGYIKQYDNDGKLKYECEYLNGELNGKGKEFYYDKLKNEGKLKKFNNQKKPIEKQEKQENKKIEVKKQIKEVNIKNNDKKEKTEDKIEKKFVVNFRGINPIPEELKNKNALYNIYLIIKDNYLSNKENYKLVLSHPLLYKSFNNDAKFLLKDIKKDLQYKISELENFLNKYDDLSYIVSEGFQPSKAVMKSLEFVDKEEIGNLIKKGNVIKEFSDIIKILLYLLEIEFNENLNGEELLIFFYSEVFDKNYKNLMGLVSDFLRKNKSLNLTKEKVDKINDIIKSDKVILSIIDMSKKNRIMIYCSFLIKEINEFINKKTSDDIPYYELKNKDKILKEYKYKLATIENNGIPQKKLEEKKIEE